MFVITCLDMKVLLLIADELQPLSPFSNNILEVHVSSCELVFVVRHLELYTQQSSHHLVEARRPDLHKLLLVINQCC